MNLLVPHFHVDSKIDVSMEKCNLTFSRVHKTTLRGIYRQNLKSSDLQDF